MTDKASAIRPDMVKPLRWSKTFEDQYEESWSASGLGGEYVVRKIFKPLSIWFYHAATEKAFLTVEEAKAHAQSHFSAAVLSVVSPAFIERIAALEAEIAGLRKSLEPFATASVWRTDGSDPMANGRPPWPKDFDLAEFAGNSLTLCDIFDAREALARTTLQEHAEDGERQGDEG